MLSERARRNPSFGLTPQTTDGTLSPRIAGGDRRTLIAVALLGALALGVLGAVALGGAPLVGSADDAAPVTTATEFGAADGAASVAATTGAEHAGAATGATQVDATTGVEQAGSSSTPVHTGSSTSAAVAAGANAPNATLVSGQPEYSNSSAGVNVTWQVQNVSNLTVTFNTSGAFPDPAATNLSIEGNASWTYGETVNVSDAGTHVNVSVDPDAGYFGDVSLDYVFENASQFENRTTGPTRVHDDPVSVPGHVDPTTLQTVLNYVANGTTVELADGTYTEQVNLPFGSDETALGIVKPLTLTAADGASPVIQVQDSSTAATTYGLFVTANATVSGVEIRGDGADFGVADLGSTTLESTTIRNATVAGVLGGGNGSVFANSTVHDATTGIFAGDEIAEIHNNSIGTEGGVLTGIFINGSSNPTRRATNVTNNTIRTPHPTNAGIALESAADIGSLAYNAINTTGDGSAGIHIRNSNATAIEGNVVNTTGVGAPGINVEGPGSHLGDVSNNTVDAQGATTAGLRVATGASAASFDGNDLAVYDQGSTALLVGNASVTDVADNDIEASGADSFGLLLRGPATAVDAVADNVVHTSGDTTPAIHVAEDATVTAIERNDANVTVANSIAIEVRSDANVTTIGNNTVSGQTDGGLSHGIHVEGTTVDAVANNTVSGANHSIRTDQAAITDVHGNVLNGTGEPDAHPLFLVDSAATNVTANDVTVGSASTNHSTAQGIVIDSTSTASLVGENVVRGADAGIFTDTDQGVVVVEGNRLENVTTGVTLNNDAHVVRDNEVVDASGRGVVAVLDPGGVVANNTVTSTGSDAIGAVGDGLTLRNNTVDGAAGFGVLSDGSDLTVSGNDVNDTDSHGIGLNGIDAVIDGNVVGNASGGHGIRVTNGTNASIVDNTVRGVAVGINPTDSVNATIARNVVASASGSGFGSSGANFTAVDNVVRDVGNRGIVLDGSTNALVARNEVNGTGSHGIHVRNGAQGAVRNNTVENGNEGILVEGAGTTVSAVEDNVVTTNASDAQGIELGNAATVATVANNTVTVRAGASAAVQVWQGADVGEVRDNVVRTEATFTAGINVEHGPTAVGSVANNTVTLAAGGSWGLRIVNATGPTSLANNSIAGANGTSVGLHLANASGFAAEGTEVAHAKYGIRINESNGTASQSISVNDTVVENVDEAVRVDGGATDVLVANVTVVAEVTKNATLYFGHVTGDVHVTNATFVDGTTVDARGRNVTVQLDYDPPSGAPTDRTDVGEYVETSSVGQNAQAGLVIPYDASAVAGHNESSLYTFRHNGSAWVPVNDSNVTEKGVVPNIFSFGPIGLFVNRSGTLDGTVTDAVSGAAIEGANVTVLVNGTPVNSTTTDASGNYSLSVPDGTHDVRVRAGGYETTTATNVSIARNATATEDVALVGNATVGGTVRDAANGEPLANATITVANGTSTYEAVTDATGTYGLNVTGNGTTYDVNASAAGYVANESVATGLALADGETATADVALVGNATLNGSVIDATAGGGVPNATVTVANGSWSYQVETDAAGDYSLNVTGNGTTYDVSASATGYLANDSAQAGLSLADGTNETANVVLTGNATLSGIVVDNVTGLPVENATVLAPGDAGEYSNVTDANGTYSLTLAGAADYEPIVNATGYVGSVEGSNVTVADGANVSYNATLVGNASIAGFVLANDSRTMENVSVAATNGSATYPATSIDNGSYTIDHVPGTGDVYEVNATARAYDENATNRTVTTAVTGVNLTVDRKANFLGVVDLSVPGSVDEGDSFTVSATIENLGTANQSNATINYTFAGSTAETRTIDLNASSNQTVQFTDSHGSPGSYDVGIASANESRTASLDVNDVSTGGGGVVAPPSTGGGSSGPDVSVVGGSVDPETATVGETVTIEVTLRNDASGSGDASVEVTAGVTTVASEDREFAGDEEVTLEYEHTFDSAGTYGVSVNGVDVGEVEVSDPGDGEPSDGTDDGGDGTDGGADNGTDETGGGDGGGDGLPGFGVGIALLALLLGLGARARSV